MEGVCPSMPVGCLIVTQCFVPNSEVTSSVDRHSLRASNVLDRTSRCQGGKAFSCPPGQPLMQTSAYLNNIQVCMLTHAQVCTQAHSEHVYAHGCGFMQGWQSPSRKLLKAEAGWSRSLHAKAENSENHIQEEMEWLPQHPREQGGFDWALVPTHVVPRQRWFPGGRREGHTGMASVRTQDSWKWYLHTEQVVKEPPPCQPPARPWVERQGKPSSHSKSW